MDAVRIIMTLLILTIFPPPHHLVTTSGQRAFYLAADTTNPSLANAESYVHPITGSRNATGIARGFDQPEHNWLPGHRGVDLFAPVGTTVLAAGDGVIAFAGTVAGTPIVSIDHPDGLRSTYQPVSASVTAGQEVTRGMPIGTLQATADGSAGLHWGILDGKDSYLNPLDLLTPPRIRLKPAN